MIAMMVPVTTGGKNLSKRPISGAIRIEITPALMIAPKIALAPSGPLCALAIATIGPTAAKVTHIITGSLMPDWIRVTRPQQNRSADQQRDLLGRQLERASDDQRHRHCHRVHHQYALKAQGGESPSAEPFVDGVDG